MSVASPAGSSAATRRSTSSSSAASPDARKSSQDCTRGSSTEAAPRYVTTRRSRGSWPSTRCTLAHWAASSSSSTDDSACARMYATSSAEQVVYTPTGAAPTLIAAR